MSPFNPQRAIVILRYPTMLVSNLGCLTSILCVETREARLLYLGAQLELSMELDRDRTWLVRAMP